MNLDAQEGMERSVDGASFSATGGTKWARHRMGRKDYTLLWNGEVFGVAFSNHVPRCVETDPFWTMF